MSFPFCLKRNQFLHEPLGPGEPSQLKGRNPDVTQQRISIVFASAPKILLHMSSTIFVYKHIQVTNIFPLDFTLTANSHSILSESVSTLIVHTEVTREHSHTKEKYEV